MGKKRTFMTSTRCKTMLKSLIENKAGETALIKFIIADLNPIRKIWSHLVTHVV